MAGSGIYAIRHLPSGRRYIGSTKDFEVRFTAHRRMLGAGRHHATVLQLLWDRGATDFAFEIVEAVDDLDRLIEREQVHMDIALAEGRARLLNGSPTAGSSRGRVEKAESNAKRSAALKGRPKAPEHIAKLRVVLTGKKRSDETRERIRQSRIGTKATPETRAKLSKISKARVRTPEWRSAMSDAHIRHHAKLRGG